MNPTPAKRPRRSLSPPNTASTQPPPTRAGLTASPSNSILPAPVPSPLILQPHPQPHTHFAPPSTSAGPSNWQSIGGWSGQRAARRSTDATASAGNIRSPATVFSEEMGEGDDMEGSLGMVLSRDMSTKAPRSMMACTRCRRQKMKCDGPAVVPCRGCKASGQPCVFEARSRPKSISVIPSRPALSGPSFYPASGRPPSSSGGRSGTPTAFYPPGPTPAPPVTTSSSSLSARLDRSREPMPPPPGASIASIASPYTASRVEHQQHQHQQPQQQQQMIYHPPPLQLPPFSSNPLNMPGMPTGPGPGPPSTATIPPTVIENRLRSIETGMRNLSAVPSTLQNIDLRLNHLQKGQDSINARMSMISASATTSSGARSGGLAPDVSNGLREAYTMRAWPLAPWLVGLRDLGGLSGLVTGWVGKGAVLGGGAGGREEVVVLEEGIRAEIGRLVTGGKDWSKEEIRALGIYATWSGDGALACLAIGHARDLGLDRLNSRRTHDDWREWVFMSIMDHLCHLVNFNSPIVDQTLAPAWREMLNNSPVGDPGTRDRDMKILAWLEYSEVLSEVYRAQIVARSNSMNTPPRSPTEREATPNGIEVWRTFNARWEAWAGHWSARNDAILSLYFNYAILYAASPLYLTSESVWTELASDAEGYAQLERGRDAAFEVIRAICSPEIGRTLPYSYYLYRPLLGLSLHHLITLALYLPTSPLISATHVNQVVRGVADALVGVGAGSGLGLVGEIVEKGDLGVGQVVLGDESGKDVWRKLFG